MNQDSALSQDQYLKARIYELKNQSDEIKLKLSKICQNINDLMNQIREKEIENQKSKSRRSFFLIFLLVIFIFVFTRYYFITSSN